ncbi:hypothetical protein B9K05_09760 [Acetobacter syzygii]|uniref:Uncharacterized protein n=1 Tax=Acetobacter syzygii TaxID=146476 RepID=A0A270BG06_9PROT|nr:hypothetical protein B9K05_09760 [Acetobacter syzygii]
MGEAEALKNKTVTAMNRARPRTALIKTPYQQKQYYYGPNSMDQIIRLKKVCCCNHPMTGGKIA